MDQILKYVIFALFGLPFLFVLADFFTMLFNLVVSIVKRDIDRAENIVFSLAVGGVFWLFSVVIFEDKRLYPLVISAVMSTFCHFVLDKIDDRKGKNKKNDKETLTKTDT